jgi:pyruvate,water dikinase
MPKQKIILKGIPASPGIVRGKVKIVRGIEDSDKFEEGSILVTKITDPSMIVMIGKAKAIVTDIGGLTSHPAIISREFGIPCVVAAQKATQVLKEGMEVEVNGSKGEVYSTF